MEKPPQQQQQKRVRGPESGAWDKLKGSTVCVEMSSGSELRGMLLWVDLFTIGVDPGSGEEIVFKHAIQRVWAL